MRLSIKARMNRLFTNGGCLDVALDHGVCNEPSFLVGLEDMPRVVDTLIHARPDAIQMAYGQADLLQSRPEKDKPALVMRHRHGQSLQRPAPPFDVGAAAEPRRADRRRAGDGRGLRGGQPVHAARRAGAVPPVRREHQPGPRRLPQIRHAADDRASGDAAQRRYAAAIRSMATPRRSSRWCGSPREMGADIIKADPTDNPEDFHRVVEAARVPVLVRGGGKEDLKAVLAEVGRADGSRGAKGMVYGRNIYQHANPKAVVNALMALIHTGADGDEAWDIYQPWLSSGRYLLGLDAGNTVIKAVLFDSRGGRSRCMRSMAGRTSRSRAMSSATSASCGTMPATAIRACIATAGDRCFGDIAAVGLRRPWQRALSAGQGRRSRCSASSRSTPRGRAFGFARSRGWRRPARDLPAAAVAVADRHAARLGEGQRAGDFARAGTAMFCKDVLTFRLTGERVSEISDMSASGMVRMPEAVYDRGCWISIGLGDAERLLPRLLDPAEYRHGDGGGFGRETGLAVRHAGHLPAISTSWPSAMGAGAVRPGEASIIAGNRGRSTRFSRPDRLPTRTSSCSTGLGPGRFVNIEIQRHLGGQSRMVCRELVERGGHWTIRSAIATRWSILSSPADDLDALPGAPSLARTLGAEYAWSALRPSWLAPRSATAARAVRWRDVRRAPAAHRRAGWRWAFRTTGRCFVAVGHASRLLVVQIFADGLGMPITVPARATGARRGDRGAGGRPARRLRGRHRGDDAAARGLRTGRRDEEALRQALPAWTVIERAATPIWCELAEKRRTRDG